MATKVKGSDESLILMSIMAGVDKRMKLGHELTNVKSAFLAEFFCIVEQYLRQEASDAKLAKWVQPVIIDLEGQNSRQGKGGTPKQKEEDQSVKKGGLGKRFRGEPTFESYHKLTDTVKNIYLAT